VREKGRSGRSHPGPSVRRAQRAQLVGKPDLRQWAYHCLCKSTFLLFFLYNVTPEFFGSMSLRNSSRHSISVSCRGWGSTSKSNGVRQEKCKWCCKITCICFDQAVVITTGHSPFIPGRNRIRNTWGSPDPCVPQATRLSLSTSFTWDRELLSPWMLPGWISSSAHPPFCPLNKITLSSDSK
jgi:hypothetical protein